jgi:hypothetical protein
VVGEARHTGSSDSSDLVAIHPNFGVAVAVGIDQRERPQVHVDVGARLAHELAAQHPVGSAQQAAGDREDQ